MVRPARIRDGAGMTHTPSPLLKAMMAAVALPLDGDVPEWVPLIPAGARIMTHDGRGPYRVEDPQAVVAASMEAARIDGDMVIDENHSTDIRAPKGEPAPARGWIKELQARDDGSIWGRVEWNGEGRALVAGRAYRGISPVFLHTAAGVVKTVLRAALTNVPNLRGLPAINMETPMSFIDEVRAALGLAATATEAEMLAAIKPAPALQSAIAEIGTALGVEGAEPKAVLAAAKLLKSGVTDVVALQAELTSVKAKLDGLTAAGKRAASEAYIDRALAEGRLGLKPSAREEYIAQHMEFPAVVEKFIGDMPKGGTSHTAKKPPEGGPITALSAEQSAAAKALGIPEAAYLKTLQAEQEKR